MRTFAYASATAILAVALAPSVRADEQLLTFVFGPSSQQTTRQGAHAAASAAHHWLQTAGAEVEIRTAGKPEPQRIASGAAYKELEQAFDESALAARDADPASFLNSLEAGVQAAATHPGARVLVAVLNTPPFSSEGEHTLEHLIEACRANSVRVLVLDIAESSKAAPNPALAALATKSGGMWLSQSRTLDPDIAVAAAASQPSEPAASTPAPVQAAGAAANPAAPGAIPQFEIPVHMRFVRTSGKGALSGAIAFEGGSGNDQAELSEETRQANESIRPMQGFILVEAPLNALKFETDDNAGTYQAHARVIATIRNEKGVAVWTGRKEVNVHGPSRKLDMRRQGSLFFMRSATLPRGTYTLEAKVEDLQGGTTGEVKTPLRRSADAPGLVASDVLAVRSYRGSADRFEADQVLAYEGDALAPVLDPVFPAERPINMQFYMVLYPDIHGALPDLSMEIKHDGRVVARMPLQFKSGLAKTAMEGKFSTMQGYGTANGAAIAGGQAKEFPYVADLKGAKFSPGNYEAVITIRQGKQIIERTTAFRVEGKAPLQVASTVAAKGAPGPAAVDEDAGVVLPEIEPATIDSTGLKMRADDQKRVWEEAAKNSLGYLAHLPNFRCTQETRRFTAPLKTPDQLKEADSFKSELVYEDGKERYQTVEVNGVKVENAAVTQGIYSRSEFGSMLRGLFDPDTAAKYKWTGRAMAMGVLCEVFEVDVARTKSNFVLRQGGRREPAGYTGRVFIDEDTGMVRRLTIEGNSLPEDFGLKSPALSLDYGMVRIGKDDFLLPLRSVLQLRHAKAFVRNETLFTRYRKFAAESEIKFQN